MKNSRKMFILTEAVLAVLVIIVAFIMFRERNGQERQRISVIVQDSDASRWSAFKYGLEMAVEDLDIEMFVVSTAGGMSVSEAEELIEREIDNGVDAVIVQPVEGDTAGEMLNRMKRKIPVMLVESRASEDKDSDLPVTEPDHYAMGKALAEELLADYDGNIQGKTLGIVSEASDSEAVRSRERGFTETLEGKGAEILWTVSRDPDEEGVSMENRPEADFVIALDDESLVKAGTASEENNLHGAVVYGIGNSTEAVYCLDFGSAECLVVPDEFNVGYQSLTEVAESLGHFSGDMENRTVSYTVMRRENLFTKENQEILFTMNQ